MTRIGNFFFHYRNGLFPLAYLLLFAKRELVTVHYREMALAGLLIALSGQMVRAVTIGLEYIIRGGRNRQVYAEKLVTGGMFAHCRNPLYVGNFLVLVGLGVASCSALFLVLAVPFFAFAYLAITLAEENYLRTHFGAEFDEYCARVNRYWPRFSGFSQTLHGMHYNWRRLLTAEYGSAYSWMAAMTLVTLQNIWIAGEYSLHDSLVLALWSLLAFLTLGYAVARYVKKSGLVQDEPKATTSAA